MSAWRGWSIACRASCPAASASAPRSRAAWCGIVPILLLDEPFAAVGPGLRREMLDLVRALQARLGLTVIMVTHDPGDARHAGGRTAFVQAGRVVLVDETERVLGSQMPDVRAYLGS